LRTDLFNSFKDAELPPVAANSDAILTLEEIKLKFSELLLVVEFAEDHRSRLHPTPAHETANFPIKPLFLCRNRVRLHLYLPTQKKCVGGWLDRENRSLTVAALLAAGFSIILCILLILSKKRLPRGRVRD
jgi:hypothetical protein